MKSKNKKLIAIIISITLLFIILWSRLPQIDAKTYFAFADSRKLLGIHNHLNVISNLPFILISLWGLKTIRKKSHFFTKKENIYLVSFCVGVFLTGLGSSYFHYTPNPSTLVWDRIPMTICFSSLLALIINDRVNPNISMTIYYLLIPSGFITVFGYAYGILNLRPYLVLQFGTLLFIIFTTLVFRVNKLSNRAIYLSVLSYVAAKFFEVYDIHLMQITNQISGHTVKHLFAALSIYILIFDFLKTHNRTTP